MTCKRAVLDGQGPVQISLPLIKVMNPVKCMIEMTFTKTSSKKVVQIWT